MHGEFGWERAKDRRPCSESNAVQAQQGCLAQSIVLDHPRSCSYRVSAAYLRCYGPFQPAHHLGRTVWYFATLPVSTPRTRVLAVSRCTDMHGHAPNFNTQRTYARAANGDFQISGSDYESSARGGSDSHLRIWFYMTCAAPALRTALLLPAVIVFFLLSLVSCGSWLESGTLTI
ncbi:LADA_0D00122g1_1 [Lachancea dasiensis]|uniref:LADA_0D00122g1_1 n=1 Tax=Lachancea dasiensis TaxID=1072105 RepID=A0A1G4J3V8_9SACH|nr:LADA_0D00122g1_1 [Lachancea dasiensis]